MFKIRPYTKADYSEVFNWWVDHTEVPPTEDLMPLESSFIAEQDSKPVASVSLYFTNTKSVCYVENLISNPKAENRSKAIEQLNGYIEEFAKQCGYKKLICFCIHPKLKARYEQLGFRKTSDGLSSFVKDLTCPQV